MLHGAIDSFYTALSALGYYHPVHPTQVHLVIGLAAGACILRFAALPGKRFHFAQSARHCFFLAFLFFFPTVLFGFTDWQHFYSGALLFPIKAKIVLAGVLMVLLVTGCLLDRAGREKSVVVLGIYLMTLFTVGGMGYFGGQLVYGKTPTPVAETYQKGESLYTAHCGGCHANGGNIITPDRPVKGSSKLSDFMVFLGWLRHPKAPMPPFTEAVLSDEDVQNLYGYITHVLEK